MALKPHLSPRRRLVAPDELSSPNPCGEVALPSFAPMPTEAATESALVFEPAPELLLAARDGDLDKARVLAADARDVFNAPTLAMLLNKALFECVHGRALFQGSALERLIEGFDDATSDDLEASAAFEHIDRCDTAALARVSEAYCESVADVRHQDMAALLIELGASPEARDDEGATPIILAARLRAWSLVEPFAALGVDPFACDERGQNVVDIATAADYAGLEKTFEALGLFDDGSEDDDFDAFDGRGEDEENDIFASEEDVVFDADDDPFAD